MGSLGNNGASFSLGFLDVAVDLGAAAAREPVLFGTSSSSAEWRGVLLGKSSFGSGAGRVVFAALRGVGGAAGGLGTLAVGFG